MTFKEFLKGGEAWSFAIYWGKNGKKYYIYPNKVKKHHLELGFDQLCEGVVWLYR